MGLSHDRVARRHPRVSERDARTRRHRPRYRKGQFRLSRRPFGDREVELASLALSRASSRRAAKSSSTASASTRLRRRTSRTYGATSASSSKTSSCSRTRRFGKTSRSRCRLPARARSDVMRQVPRVLRPGRALAQEPHVPERTLGRRAAADRDRASAGQQPEDFALRRADREPRSRQHDRDHGASCSASTSRARRSSSRPTTKPVVDRMRRRVIRLEDGHIVADEERGYYHAASGSAGADVALARSRNGLGKASVLPG